MTEIQPAQEESVDPGLFSLSQIMHLMRIEFSRAQRYRYPLACMIVAIDRLPALRDLYGYDSKEAILAEVVRLIQKQTRGSDFLGRLGDDRLLLLVPHNRMGGVRSLADRLLSAASGLEFDGEGKSIQITLSIGSSHNAEGGTLFFDAMLKSAEGALEEAFTAGGDHYIARDPGAAAG